MYKINNYPLHNPEKGWRLLRSSMPLPEYGMRSVQAEYNGRDGTTVYKTTRDVSAMSFSVETTNAGLPGLLSLLSQSSISITSDENPGKVAQGRLVSASPDTYHPVPDVHQYTFLIEIPEGAWRGVVETTSALTPAAGAGASQTMFAGLTAPVQDALIRVKGPIVNPQVVDSSGAFFTYQGAVSSTQYVRFDSNTGRAWRTTTNVWTGGTEVSGLIDFGGPRGVFEIAPHSTNPANPTITVGRITLTQESFGAGAALQIRGRSANLF